MSGRKTTCSYQVILTICLCIYLIAGVKTDLFLVTWKPASKTLMEDFRIYEQALDNALAGSGPYSVRDIGEGYLYPPPALFVVEIFRHINPFHLKFLIYSAFNITLLVFIVYGIAKLYGYSIRETWYWHIICLGSAPFHELIYTGQINIVTLFGIFIFFLWQESSPTLSGSGLSLAVLTKVSPLALIWHLISAKNYKAMVGVAIWMVIFTTLSILRYGLSSMIVYPEFFWWLSSQFPIDNNSQSLVSKLVMVMGPIIDGSTYQIIQRALMLYVLLIIIVTILLTLIGKQSKEPSFIIIMFGMTILPNVMWYHHYVFLLLPMLVWIGWKRLDPRTTIWCLAGLIIIQVDRYHLTYGLLIHIFAHISILILLTSQIQQYYLQRQTQSTIPRRESS